MIGIINLHITIQRIMLVTSSEIDIFVDGMKALSSGNVLHHNYSFILFQLIECSFIASMTKNINVIITKKEGQQDLRSCFQSREIGPHTPSRLFRNKKDIFS